MIGERIKLGGYRRDPVDKNDKKYGAGRFNSKELPPRVDLRPYMTKVEQQGEVNSCTANAMAGAYEYLAKREFGHAEDVSRLFIYYNARDVDGSVDEDEGTYLRSCIKVLREYGACSEETWPYHPDNVFDEPDENAYEEAGNFLIDDAQRIDVDLYAMKHCLAEGYPFAFGLQLFSSFDEAEKNGQVSIPDTDEEEDYGGHAMLCVGYSDTDEVFVVRNSWGSSWGDKGYCYIPYDYMTDPELNGDCWTIRSVTNADYSEDVWLDAASFFDMVAGVSSSISSILLSAEEEYDEEEQEEYDEEE